MSSGNDTIRCSNIVYKPTKKYVKTEEKPPTELTFEVSGDWVGLRWFSNQTLVTKKMICDETGFSPEQWDEEIE